MSTAWFPVVEPASIQAYAFIIAVANEIALRLILFWLIAISLYPPVVWTSDV